MEKKFFLALPFIIALSGCYPTSRTVGENIIEADKVSVCVRFVKDGSAQQGSGSLRVLAYDDRGAHIDTSTPIEYYPNRRSCTLLTVTPAPTATTVKGFYIRTYDGIPYGEIHVDELVLTVDGSRIGGTISNYEERGKVLRVDVDFDFNNPSAEPGDIVAKWLKLLGKSNQRVI